MGILRYILHVATFYCILAAFSLQVVLSQNATKVADMHYHLSLKKYNENGLKIRDELDEDALDGTYIWEDKFVNRLKVYKDGKWIKKSEIVKKYFLSDSVIVRPTAHKNNGLYHYSQATIPHMQEGNVKLAYNAISPFERNFADDWWARFVSKNFKSNGDKKWLKTVGKNPDYSHWQNFKREYQFIINQDTVGKLPGGQEFSWRFLRKGSELDDEDANFVVLVVEGGHIFQNKKFPYVDYKDNEEWLKMVSGEISCEEARNNANSLMRELLDNIKEMKNFPVPIKMVTIGHLSYNGMLDHAPALDANGIGKTLVKRMYRIKVSDYREFVEQWSDFYYSELGVNIFGKTLIDSLIDPSFGGSTVLVDLKHSAFSTRKYFLDSIIPKYAERGIKVPPIYSHGAATGLSELYDSPLVDQYALLDSEGTKKLYPFGINLYDEEIKKIIEHDGIIGLALEQRVLGGYVNERKRVKKIKKHLRRNYKGSRQPVITFYDKYLSKKDGKYVGRKKKTYKLLLEDYWSAEPFLQNLFYILSQSDKPHHKAWENVCLGSDLDGIIDPIQICPSASQYPYFRERLESFIPIFLELNPNYKEEDFFKELGKYNKELDQLFYESLKKFTKCNF